MKILESVPLACCCVWAIHLLSADQMGFTFILSAGVPVVRCLVSRIRVSKMSISNTDDVLGLTMYARYLPLGDQVGLSSEISRVLVMFITWPVLGETKKMSHCSSPL